VDQKCLGAQNPKFKMESEHLLRMWDDIKTWIENNKVFVFTDLTVEVPSDDGYWAWRN